jgi:hypothetical protein
VVGAGSKAATLAPVSSELTAREKVPMCAPTSTIFGSGPKPRVIQANR